MAKKKQSTPLSNEAIEALRSSEYSGSSFALPPGQLECYAEVKAVVALLGGKWVSKSGRHVFSDGVDAESLVMSVCDRGEIPPSNPNDFFPTPKAVVEEVVGDEWFQDRVGGLRAMREEQGLRWLEPNGGSGALAREIVSQMGDNDELVICEINPLMVDSLKKEFPKATVIEGDFLDYRDDRGFDVVFMNPPFNGKEYIRHVKHAEGMLNRYGIVAAIVPSMFHAHDHEFGYHVAETGEQSALGAKRFEGTDVATSAIFLENDPQLKWREGPHQGYSTHHAWNVVVAISSDQDMLKRLERTPSFEGATGLLDDWARRQVVDGHAVRVDEQIASEVILSLSQDYNFAETEHLVDGAKEAHARTTKVPMTPARTDTVRAPSDEDIGMPDLSCPVLADVTAIPVTASSPRPQSEFAF